GRGRAQGLAAPAQAGGGGEAAAQASQGDEGRCLEGAHRCGAGRRAASGPGVLVPVGQEGGGPLLGTRRAAPAARARRGAGREAGGAGGAGEGRGQGGEGGG